MELKDIKEKIDTWFENHSPNEIYETYMEYGAIEEDFKIGDRVVVLESPHIWRVITDILEDGTYVLDHCIYDVQKSDLTRVSDKT